MRRLLIILGLLWGVGALMWWYSTHSGSHRVTFRTDAIRRGDLQATIDATGTIEPEEVVDVGVQVAGRISSFGEDPRDPKRPISYGTPIEEGTVLAKLDDALFKARQAQARANLAKAEADVEQSEAKLRQAQRELDRQKRMQQRGPGITSQQDFDTALANFEGAQAALAVSRGSVAVAKADLEEASVNLGYTTIRSPVKGVILDRRVNIGQTVVASLNAPSLFLIAKDLRRMEIWASVNETDIGAVHPGQGVKFTIGAFANETFHGRVTQIRLNASMVQGVVTYTVVIEVDNPDGKLLPYLTARLRFEVEGRQGVLHAANAALRWQPRPEDVDPEAGDALAQARKRTSASQSGTLWIRQGDFVRPIAVTVGLSDGTRTEVSGAGLRAGAEVVVGAVRQSEADTASSIIPYMTTD